MNTTDFWNFLINSAQKMSSHFWTSIVQTTSVTVENATTSPTEREKMKVMVYFRLRSCQKHFTKPHGGETSRATHCLKHHHLHWILLLLVKNKSPSRQERKKKKKNTNNIVSSLGIHMHFKSWTTCTSYQYVPHWSTCISI